MAGTAPCDYTPSLSFHQDPESKASSLRGQLAPVPYDLTLSQDLESKNSSVVAWPEADQDRPSIPTSLWAEGGFLGCLTLFGGFVGSFATMGQVTSFGTYQAWYAEHQLSAYSPSAISWIGGLQLWVMMFSVSRPPLLKFKSSFFLLFFITAGRNYWSLIRRLWTHAAARIRDSYIYAQFDDDVISKSVLPVYDCSRTSSWVGGRISVSFA
jgi:hypothetical protein